MIEPYTLAKIEDEWNHFNSTQLNILFYLFKNQSATKDQLADYCDAHKNTISKYLNKFTATEILDRISPKQRDLNAIYQSKQQYRKYL